MDVEILVDCSGNRLNSAAKFLFNFVEIVPIIPCHKVDGNTQVTKASATTNSMEVGLSVLGEVEVNDDVDGLNINTTSEKI